MSAHAIHQDSQDQSRHLRNQAIPERRERLLESFTEHMEGPNDSIDCRVVFKDVSQLITNDAKKLEDIFTAANEDPEAIKSKRILPILTELHMNLDAVQHLLSLLDDTPFTYQARQQLQNKDNLDSYDFFAGLAFGSLVGTLGVLALALVIEVQMQHLGCSRRIGALICTSLCFFALVYFCLLTPFYRPKGE